MELSCLKTINLKNLKLADKPKLPHYKGVMLESHRVMFFIDEATVMGGGRNDVAPFPTSPPSQTED